MQLNVDMHVLDQPGAACTCACEHHHESAAPGHQFMFIDKKDTQSPRGPQQLSISKMSIVADQNHRGKRSATNSALQHQGQAVVYNAAHQKVIQQMYAQANENIRPLHMSNLVNKSPVVRVPAQNVTMVR